MKLHSDTITTADIYAARDYAADTMGGVLTVGITQTRSTARGRAFDVRLTGDGTQGRKQSTAYRGVEPGQYSAGYASWGWLMAFLYDIDPAAMWGSPGRPTYADKHDFHAATRCAFDTDIESPEERRAATVNLRAGSRI